MELESVETGLESVEGGSPGLREREWKFVVVPDVAARFVESIEGFTAPELFDASRPIAWTRTTYLDTAGLAYFRATGDIARKLRVRQYACATDPESPAILAEACYLELKESGGNARSKCRFSASAALVGEIVRTHGEVSVDLPPGGAFDMIRGILRRDRPEPQVTTWYRRESRIGDGVRITLDSKLCFALPEMPGAPGKPAAPARIAASFPFQIVEVKHRGAAPDWLCRAMLSLPGASVFSKFSEGMSCLGFQRGTE